ncbi:hypothetical protein M9H77_07144 [Catharanthus roseus]|uniref:Uncharacterized protein n=1 Tax=Catharanthus roseus TaxID=4058 RepID=A0ACC0BUA6_CATRO|nr:hypothetical protein M9H77_07144 [Catharanthus roseus]
MATKGFYLLFKINLCGNLLLQFTGFVYIIFKQILTRPSRTQNQKACCGRSEENRRKFDHATKEIQDKNVDAFIYLMKIDPEKWTPLHDGGHKHGIMTTNISGALNSILKKARVLPLKSLVELIFNKLVRYFHQHREEAQNCVYPFSTRIFDKLLRIEMKSREHKVTLTIHEKEYIWSDLRSGDNGTRADTYVPEI